jgi:hypothetical protein
MMGFLEAILALVGFAAVVFVCAAFVSAWMEAERSEPPPDPYRDGLDATARISTLAFQAALER